MSTEAVPLNPTIATQTLEPLLSINETARILAVSPATIRTWIHRKRIAYVKMGRRVGCGGSVVCWDFDNPFSNEGRLRRRAGAAVFFRCIQ